MIFTTNKILLGLIAVFLIGVIYFGFQEFNQINNQLASLQVQLNPIIEEPIEVVPEEPMAPATTTEAAESSPEPEEEVNVCDSLNCNELDGWNNTGSTFTCQNSSNQTCTCQTEAYFNYSCSTAKQKCVYSTTDTRTSKYNCAAPAYPDLIFQAPGFSPASPVAEDQMYFWATLKNQGLATAASSLSYLKVDGQKIDEFSTISLASNGSIVVAWATAWPATAGPHELEVCADGGLQVPESNETNNCNKITITVEEGSTAILPDLLVDSIEISPDPLSAGQSVSFSVTVQNRGNAIARASLTVPTFDLGNDGSEPHLYFGAMQTKQIPAGGSETVFWRNVWTSVSGRHKIEVCADAVSESELRITELRENNNCFSRIITVP